MGKTGLILMAAAAVFAVAACTMTPEDPVVGAGACSAEQFAYLIGESEAEARAANLPPLHRVYTEGDPVTMDYRPDRINVVLDESGTVVEIKCG